MRGIGSSASFLCKQITIVDLYHKQYFNLKNH